MTRANVLIGGNLAVSLPNAKFSPCTISFIHLVNGCRCLRDRLSFMSINVITDEFVMLTMNTYVLGCTTKVKVCLVETRYWGFCETFI